MKHTTWAFGRTVVVTRCGLVDVVGRAMRWPGDVNGDEGTSDRENGVCDRRGASRETSKIRELRCLAPRIPLIVSGAASRDVRGGGAFLGESG